jgi:hypothetical protein
MPIYLEAKTVLGTSYYHLYLVKRDAPQSPDDLNSLAWRSTGSVLRGGSTVFGSVLTTQNGLLADSEDAFSPTTDVSSRPIWTLNLSDSDWATMSNVLNGIGAADYSYELPFSSRNSIYHVANSDATVFTLLNAVGVDVRSIIGNLNAPGCRPRTNTAWTGQLDRDPGVCEPSRRFAAVASSRFSARNPHRRG